MLDVEHAMKESGLGSEALARLQSHVRSEFPDDPAMAELHLLRILLAISRGWVTPEAALSEAVRTP